MTITLGALTDTLMQRASGHSRFIVAIAGPPGAGKSTLADALYVELTHRGEKAEVLPMDGFHMDNGILRERGLLARKGAPETFDVRGFFDIVTAVIKADQDVLVPVFDRSREIAIASARSVSSETRFILAEGNYLLLNEEPWIRLKDSFDFSIFVGPTVEVLEQRLRDRWIGYGLDDAGIAAKLYENDLPNGKRVVQNSQQADIKIDIWE
ncbi:nucleoside triphosphate hydrolase [Agrobacterium rosae]|uniref:Pantothenate kinase n=1 Tax=Agrobacterium rosae TaxID=1972867 RepID=A0A1R3TLI8_9HYPH|nr:nucleoside triphosphate hydrolase [Agrobacterium rosae]SCX22488.1 Pantothenate kinase [Agrobacterium rosae]